MREIFIAMMISASACGQGLLKYSTIYTSVLGLPLARRRRNTLFHRTEM